VIVPLAHHGLLLALPFVLPAIMLGLRPGWLALRDRLRHRNGSKAS
jgi:hypothetical protein